MKFFWTYRSFVAAIVVILFLSSCYKEYEITVHPNVNEDYYLLFNDQPVAYDSVKKMMLFSVPQPVIENFQISIYSEYFSIIEIDNKLVESENLYQFDVINTDDEFAVKIQYNSGEQDMYYLQFTTLPIVQIYTSEPIPNEPKISSRIVYSDPNSPKKFIDTYAGIEQRGGTAFWNPKKSYGFECWQDAQGLFLQDISFYGLESDDDWILDAMYVDKARFRKALSFQLWDSIHHERISELGVDKVGVDGGFVEVFLNNEFLGLYNLTERIDKKRLGIQDSESTLQGLIFKSIEKTGTTNFVSMAPRTGGSYWEGWELIYPENWGDNAWTPFQDFIDFVVNSNDENFTDSIFTYLNMNNCIDYFILLNLTKAYDNYDKNMFFVRNDSLSPFFIIPWDLDATWGRTWKGYVLSADSILTNGLYERIMELEANNYNYHLAQRWEDLREGVVTEPQIFSLLDCMRDELIYSGAYQRELETWPESELNIDEEIDYIKNWTSDRLVFLDNYFEN